MVKAACLSVGCLTLVVSLNAQGGLFDDDEARKGLQDLRKEFTERSEQQNRSLLEFANQLQSLREENARLRGQLDNQQFRLDSSDKRQQDFYIDLDQRLRQVEQKQAAAAAVPPAAVGNETLAPIGNTPGTANDGVKGDKTSESGNPAEWYENALTLFKTSKFKEAAAAFDSFGQHFANHALAPGAMLWLGYSYAAQQDCSKASAAYQRLLARWPTSNKAPDAMFSLAECQSGPSAKKTLQQVIDTYPNSNAATKARQKLKAKP